MTDPIQELRQVDVPLSDAEIAAAEARTIARYRAPARPARRRAWRLPALGLAAVAAAALTIVGVNLGGGTNVEHASAATRFLRDVAATAGGRGDVKLGPGQLFAVRHVEDQGDGAVFESRLWQRADGSGRRQWLRDGDVKQDKPLAGGPSEAPRNLPTEPRALAKRLREIIERPQPVYDAPGGRPTGKTLRVRADARQIVLAAVAMLDSTGPLAADLRRALFEVMAGYPGVRYIGATQDPLGRPGVAVAVDGDAAHEFYGREVIIDPKTSELLGTVDYRHGDIRKIAGVSVRQATVVDRLGTVPADWNETLRIRAGTP